MTAIALAILTALVAGDPAEPAADEARSEEPALEETVEVRAEAPLDLDVAAFSTTIAGDELAGRGVDLADVLRRVPGAHVRDYGGLGSYATVSVRASTPEQVVVLVDGVPRNRALGGAVDLSSIPASQIDSVTVYRGFAPAALGQSGIGGVVSVRTRAAGDGAGGSADLLAGELDTARLSGDLALPLGEHGRLAAGAEALTSDGDFHYLDTGTVPDFDPTDDVVVERNNNELAQGALDMRYSRSALGAGELALALRLRDRERGVPGPDGYPSDTAELDESLHELQATYEATPGANVRLALDAHASREELRFRDPLGLRATDAETVLDGQGLGATAGWDHGRHHWLARVDLAHERAESSDFALAASDRGGAERLATAWTIEDVFTVGRVTLAPSTRWQTRDDDFLAGAPGVVPPPAADVREDDLTGKLGVAVVLTPRMTLRGTAGTSYRAPSLVELFGDRGAMRGNPDLAAEHGRGFDVGVASGSRSGKWSAEIAAFARRTDDLIVLEPQSQGALVPLNLAEAEVLGIETNLSAKPFRDFSLDLSLTLQDPRDTSGGGDEPLPFEPETLGWAGFRWTHGSFQAGWELTHVGSNSFGDEQIDARTIHDARFSWSVSRRLAIGLEARNVFDRMTRDVARYPLPDRVLAFHVGWRSSGAGT